jgi:CheY-like chemotaxis protein
MLPIMYIEDDAIDAMTVKRAFGELKVKNELIHKLNGEEALEYLTGNGHKKPCVILLDLNMPKMDGITFLRRVKLDEELKGIPVIVLTTSREERDIAESFKLSAAGYIIKPIDYKKFVEAIRTLDLYWTLCELPDGE